MNELFFGVNLEQAEQLFGHLKLSLPRSRLSRLHAIERENDTILAQPSTTSNFNVFCCNSIIIMSIITMKSCRIISMKAVIGLYVTYIIYLK